MIMLRELFLLLLFGFFVDRAMGVEIESLKSALKAALGPVKGASKKQVTHQNQTVDIYYEKKTKARFAVVQKRIYDPNCTHTWVIGIDGKTSTVTTIRMVEYSCPHAKPASKASFFEQYKGKGPADTKTLKASISTIAKATGTCDLTTDAVITAIESIDQLKKTL